MGGLNISLLKRKNVILKKPLQVPPAFSTSTSDSWTWQEQLERSIKAMLDQPAFKDSIHPSHFTDTPKRFRKALEEYFSGVFESPESMLRTSFIKGSYDEMILLTEVPFVSHCSHHLAAFIGTYTFGYLPKKHIVGLSKIPRMIEVFCNRPQVQENLSQQIVETFQKIVKPRGCGVVMDAVHHCACIRGVKKTFNTRTAALTGAFHKDSIKGEFYHAVKPR